jgi:hypothetical protein
MTFKQRNQTLQSMAAAIKHRREARWTIAELKLIGKVPDSVLARRIGRTIKEIVEERQWRRIRLVTPPRRWTARETKLLGRYFDEELARRFRRPVHDVARQRIALQIPAFRPHKSKKWTRAEEKILGMAEDKVIAMRLGRTRNAVLQHRRILGIPPMARFFPNGWTVCLRQEWVTWFSVPAKVGGEL